MTVLATSAKPFIEQIPAKDRGYVEKLQKMGCTVGIFWTSEGWRYEVKFP